MPNQTLNDFIATWKPMIRPQGLAEALVITYRLRPKERSDFARLPIFLADYDMMWLREFSGALRKHSQVRAKLREDDLTRMRHDLNQHREILKRNQFDARYLDSIENLALFFLYHGILPLWVVGCYDVTKNKLLEALSKSTDHSEQSNALALQQAISTLALMDCTQLHRVYNFYDHHMADTTRWRRLSIVEYAIEEAATDGLNDGSAIAAQ